MSSRVILLCEEWIATPTEALVVKIETTETPL